MNSILINFDQTSYFPLSIQKHSHTWCAGMDKNEVSRERTTLTMSGCHWHL